MTLWWVLYYCTSIKSLIKVWEFTSHSAAFPITTHHIYTFAEKQTLYTITKCISLWSSPWEISYAYVHLCSSHCIFPFKANPKLISFLPYDRKKKCIWIWSVPGPDLKYSDSHSEMRPRLKSHVDQAYHHRFMTYWAQADGGWFSLSKKKKRSWFLSGGSSSPSPRVPLCCPPRELKVSFWHDGRHHLISNEICFEEDHSSFEMKHIWIEKSDLLPLCSMIVWGKAPVCTKHWMLYSLVIAAGLVGCSSTCSARGGRCLWVVQMEK